MTDNHPITPPPELVEQWHNAWIDAKVKHDGLIDFLVAQAAQWGADQELKVCCEWLYSRCLISGADELRAARRPKPPSDKELALEALHRVKDLYPDLNNKAAIRRAIEQLPD